jgi:hypothetical protein
MMLLSPPLFCHWSIPLKVPTYIKNSLLLAFYLFSSKLNFLTDQIKCGL